MKSKAEKQNSNVGATTGEVLKVTLADEYASYDRLPPRIREAISRSPVKIGADQIEANWIEAQKDGWTEKMLIDWINGATTRNSKADLETIYPPGYPIFSRSRKLR